MKAVDVGKGGMVKSENTASVMESYIILII